MGQTNALTAARSSATSGTSCVIFGRIHIIWRLQVEGGRWKWLWTNRPCREESLRVLIWNMSITSIASALRRLRTNMERETEPRLSSRTRRILVHTPQMQHSIRRNVTEVSFQPQTLPLRSSIYGYQEGIWFPNPPSLGQVMERSYGALKRSEKRSKCFVQADPRSDETLMGSDMVLCNYRSRSVLTRRITRFRHY
jgi:hypothetical protein